MADRGCGRRRGAVHGGQSSSRIRSIARCSASPPRGGHHAGHRACLALGLGGPHVSNGLVRNSATLARPLAGAIVTYFLREHGPGCNGAIGLSTGRSPMGGVARGIPVERRKLLRGRHGGRGWAAGWSVARGITWLAAFMIAPVYLTYWTYQVFSWAVSKIERLHREHLSAALADMTRLKELRNQLLEREQIAAVAPAGQSREGRVPRDRLARAAHAAQRDPRLGAHAPRRRRCRRRRRPRRASRSSSATRSAQAQLIEDLLDVSRIISGKLRLEHRVASSCGDDRREAASSVRPAADAKGVTSHVDVEPRPRPFSATPTRLQQVSGTCCPTP